MKLTKDTLRDIIKEEVDEWTHVGEMYGIIYRKHGKTPFNGAWKLHRRDHSGTWSWYNTTNDVIVDATPWYEGTGGIPVQIRWDDDSNPELVKSIPFKRTNNSTRDAAKYLQKMASVLKSIRT